MREENWKIGEKAHGAEKRTNKLNQHMASESESQPLAGQTSNLDVRQNKN